MRYCLLILVLSMTAYAAADTLPVPTGGPDAERLAKAFRKIELKPGLHHYKLANGQNQTRFWVRVPEDLSESHTLVIALHWAGGGSTYREFFECLAVPGLAALDAIIIAPEGNGQTWDRPLNAFNVLELRKLAIAHWPVDEARVALTGYSNGAIGCLHFSLKYPELFAAAIPVAGSYFITQRIRVPLYIIHGAADELFSLDAVRREVTAAKRSGTSIRLSVAEGLSHYQACAYPAHLQAAADWLVREVWP